MAAIIKATYHEAGRKKTGKGERRGDKLWKEGGEIESHGEENVLRLG